MNTATSGEPTTSVARRRRFASPILAFVAANPASAALAAVILISTLTIGLLWGVAPTELAAGAITTFQLGYWWTLVTALLIPDSIVDAILCALLALTVMAYIERLLGTLRTVLVFFLIGAAGILLGAGAEALLTLLGDSTAQVQFVLDPATGIFAVIMAGSALAPALFRRRIRVLGFALLLMFALYAGDTDSVYRLAAAILGYLAGHLLAHGHSTAPWRRSSFQETRTLIAAVVAVTGLGPLIVLISGTWQGALSLVVAGFSLIPLILSLIAGWGLRTGRRSALLLAIVTNLAVSGLTAISLGAAELFQPDTLGQVAPQFVLQVAGAVIVPLAVVAVLVLTRRRFQVSAPRLAVKRFATIIAIGFLVVVLAEVILGLVDRGGYLSPPTIIEIFTWALLSLVPAGFLVGVPVAAAPVSGLDLFAFQWFGIVFWAVFVVATLQLYRATASRQDEDEVRRFRTLLRRNGGGTLGFMGTWAGNSYWFSPDGKGAVAYRVINGVALTTSDPVCAHEDDIDVVRGFVDFCDSQGWSPVFYSFHERYLPIFTSFGWQHMSVGEETVLELPRLDMAGKPWQKVRQALNKGTRAGMTTLWSTWGDLPLSISTQIDAISEQWVAEKELPEMGFTLGGIAELKDADVHLYLALGPEGKLEAITSWLPSWTDERVTGWTIDFMRRGDDSMPGIMEYIIASAALHMKDLGAEVMSLSGAPLATKPQTEDRIPEETTVMTRLLNWLGGALEPAYGFTSLFKFKSKFNPQYETIHMTYSDPADLARIGLAIGKAYLPEVSTREYIALAKTLSGGRGSH